MMRSKLIHILPLLLLLASCGEKERTGTVSTHPAIRVELEEASAFWASFSVQTLACTSLRYGLSEDMPMRIDMTSDLLDKARIQLSDLLPVTSYTFYIQGIGRDGEEGSVMEVAFKTIESPDGLYPWESARSALPSFADMTLVTMGWHNSNPPKWTRERFASHVQYKDREGHSYWLFDSFLCIDGIDPVRGRILSISAGSRPSGVKASWEGVLEAWTGDNGALKELDAAVEEAAASLGAPRTPRYVVMGIPDPIRYELFKDPASSTTYWGELDGVPMDFSKVKDQVAACKWYMNLCRERFYACKFKHLELAGFYILSEELPLDPAFYQAAGQSYDEADTWNWRQKNWELIVPQLSSYAHSCMEGLWWIPYHLAPGYKVWKQLGFDNVFMQPNYYWDHDAVSHPLTLTKKALKDYKMGMELEFEFSLVADVMKDGRSGPDGAGNPTFDAGDVPLLRSRLREYMQACKDAGLYGKLPIAVYSGTDAMHQLATSPDAGDKDMYRDLCEFIIGSPLKK